MDWSPGLQGGGGGDHILGLDSLPFAEQNWLVQQSPPLSVCVCERERAGWALLYSIQQSPGIAGSTAPIAFAEAVRPVVHATMPMP